MKLNEIKDNIYIQEIQYDELDHILSKYEKYKNWNDKQFIKAYIEPISDFFFIDRIESLEYAFNWQTLDYNNQISYFVIECNLDELLRKLVII